MISEAMEAVHYVVEQAQASAAKASGLYFCGIKITNRPEWSAPLGAVNSGTA